VSPRGVSPERELDMGGIGGLVTRSMLLLLLVMVVVVLLLVVVMVMVLVLFWLRPLRVRRWYGAVLIFSRDDVEPVLPVSARLRVLFPPGPPLIFDVGVLGVSIVLRGLRVGIERVEAPAR